MATMPVTTPLDDENSHAFEVGTKRKPQVETTTTFEPSYDEPSYNEPLPQSQPSQSLSPNNNTIALLEDTVSIILSFLNLIDQYILWCCRYQYFRWYVSRRNLRLSISIIT